MNGAICSSYISQWLSDCCSKVTELGVFGDKTPNHVLVNEYAPGQGIMVHIACLLIPVES